MKKICALILSTILMCSVLTGCGASTIIKIATTGNVLTAPAGGTIEFTAEVIDGKAGGDIVFMIKSGSDNAIITKSEKNKAVLTMRPTAVAGGEIVVIASDGKAVSNEITVTVQSVPVQSISISSGSANLVLRGEQISFSAAILPLGASASGLTYEITEGAAFAELTEQGKLTVKSNAPVSSVIKVVAKIGAITSNECVFTVDENAATEFTISLSRDSIDVDSNAANTPNITATVLDADDRVIKDAKVSYSVSSGSEFIEVQTIDSVGILTQKGHGKAIVEARVVGTNAKMQCEINSIVPPDAFTMPANLPASKEVKFGYSRADKLAYLPQIAGEKVCTDYKVEFVQGSAVSADLATFNAETHEITFAETTSGAVEVVVTSVSGSVKETVFKHNVIVNNGINVETMAEFLSVMNNYAHQSDEAYKTINLMKNIIGLDGLEESQQTIPLLLEQYAYSFGDRTIYGNNFNIDLSNLRIPGYTEWSGMMASNFPSFITFWGYAADLGGRTYVSTAKEYTIEIYDLAIKSALETNSSYTAEEAATGNGTPSNRSYRRAIYLNPLRPRIDHDTDPTTATKLDEANSQICKDFVMQNVSVSGFYIGTGLQGIVDGKITDCYFGNSFAASLDIGISMVTLKDIDFGPAGVASMEISSAHAKESGLLFKDKQRVTFTGKFTCDNFANGTAPHIANDKDLKLLIPVAKANLSGALSGTTYPNEQIANVIQTREGKEGFIWFIFIQGDTSGTPSEIIFEAGKLADYFTQLNGTADDKVYEYIKADVKAPVGVQILQMGTVYLLNLNYAK